MGRLKFWWLLNVWDLVRCKSQGSRWGKTGEGTELHVGKRCPCVSDSLGLALASSLSCSLSSPSRPL